MFFRDWKIDVWRFVVSTYLFRRSVTWTRARHIFFFRLNNRYTNFVCYCFNNICLFVLAKNPFVIRGTARGRVGKLFEVNPNERMKKIKKSNNQYCSTTSKTTAFPIYSSPRCVFILLRTFVRYIVIYHDFSAWSNWRETRGLEFCPSLSK